MIFVLAAMLIGGLLVAGALAAASGDQSLSRKSTAQTASYYAATAGVQRYEYELSHNPNFWVECPALTVREVPGAPEEEYTATTLAAKGYTKCEKGVQASILETSGAARGTFRVLITATAGTGANKTTHKIVAVFSHPGFTKYVYESNYEVEDPSNFSPEPTSCEHYYAERVTKKLTSTCPPIEFAPEDKVNGPMHTNDAADICAEGTKKPTFGREGREDAIEMLGGHYASSGCKNEGNFQGKYTEEAEALLPPETDSELLESATYKFSGRTVIVLNTGTPNTMTVTNKGTTTTKEFPSNGVVYVENSSEGCGIGKYTPFGPNTTTDTGCGNVYVSGSYTESLTIASANDVIVNGNLTTTHESNGEPTGGGTLGLIAENFVRVYHPVKEKYEVENYMPKSEAPVGTECLTEFSISGKLRIGIEGRYEPVVHHELQSWRDGNWNRDSYRHHDQSDQKQYRSRTFEGSYVLDHDDDQLLQGHHGCHLLQRHQKVRRTREIRLHVPRKRTARRQVVQQLGEIRERRRMRIHQHVELMRRAQPVRLRRPEQMGCTGKSDDRRRDPQHETLVDRR